MLGRLCDPIGSTFSTIDGIGPVAVNSAVRAYGLPLKIWRLADTITSAGKRYAPDALPSHSQVRFAVLISALGLNGGMPAVPLAVITDSSIFVAEYANMNCQPRES